MFFRRPPATFPIPVCAWVLSDNLVKTWCMSSFECCPAFLLLVSVCGGGGGEWDKNISFPLS